MRTVLTIEARVRSSRLPGKVLRPILGRPMLARMIERVRRVEGIDAIVVATTTDPADDAIVAAAAAEGVGCHRGSETDVLQRVLDAALAANADLIVETTGDCPLIDPEVVDRVIDSFHGANVDYCSNTLRPTYPRGLDVQVFPTAVLRQVSALTRDPADREHVSLYIYEHPERFRLLGVESGDAERLGGHRWTVDTVEDFELVTAIYQALYPRRADFGWRDVVALLESRPDLRAINESVRQKAIR
jgi:spore coat polysaccharide biosynthesis protein SpsF